MRLFTGARILAMDGTEPAALAVADGRVVATGGVDELRSAHPGAERVDLDGALVVPGFHDAHCHPTHAVYARVRGDLADATRVEHVVETLAARAARTPAGTKNSTASQ